MLSIVYSIFSLLSIVRTKKGLQMQAFLFPMVFHVSGLNDRRLWICDFPDLRLSFLFFHDISPLYQSARKRERLCSPGGTILNISVNFSDSAHQQLQISEIYVIMSKYKQGIAAVQIS